MSTDYLREHSEGPRGGLDDLYVAVVTAHEDAVLDPVVNSLTPTNLNVNVDEEVYKHQCHGFVFWIQMQIQGSRPWSVNNFLSIW